MKTIIGAIQSFITHFLALGMITSGLLLVAGEIRLAALKKASSFPFFLSFPHGIPATS